MHNENKKNVNDLFKQKAEIYKSDKFNISKKNIMPN